jgi:phosphoribosylamine--glycine ligase
MGAYSPIPDLDDAAVEAVIETIHRPILAEMARRGARFRGFLYAGLMLTTDGPVMLEVNVRLGDPEAQVILPRVAADLGPLLLAAAQGSLAGTLPPRVPVVPGAAVGIVLAAEGYPGDPRRGDAISGLDTARDGGALVFHAGTASRQDGTGFETNGGRVLTVVGRGRDLVGARAAAEAAAEAVTWGGQQRRHDIAADLPRHAVPGAAR